MYSSHLPCPVYYPKPPLYATALSLVLYGKVSSHSSLSRFLASPPFRSPDCRHFTHSRSLIPELALLSQPSQKRQKLSSQVRPQDKVSPKSVLVIGGFTYAQEEWQHSGFFLSSQQKDGSLISIKGYEFTLFPREVSNRRACYPASPLRLPLVTKSKSFIHEIPQIRFLYSITLGSEFPHIVSPTFPVSGFQRIQHCSVHRRVAMMQYPLELLLIFVLGHIL